jgi:general secretion pathway protein A
MYLSFFGLTEAPFSIAPSPRYLYMSQRHQEALAHLLYGVNGEGGFVLLTGEVGTGKTTVSRCLLEQIPESCEVAYIFNPKLTVEELLSTICAEFRIACPPGNTSIKVFVDCINAHLLDVHARGGHSVLIIDEAQNLSTDVLEQMRLLTNLETNERKLLQIILIGQPELAEMLQRPELRQLAQRIVARYHLGPLTRPEVAAYVQHRLDVAGTQRPLFPASITGRLHRLSGGIPRLINVLCDRALLGAYTQGKDRVDRATLVQAAREVLRKPATPLFSIRRSVAAGLVLLAGGALAVMILQREPPATNTLAAPPPVAAPTAQPPQAGPPVHGERAKAAPAVLSETLEWPAALSAADSQIVAYAALFRAWGAEYAGADACVQAESLELRCRTGTGGLNELRELNRPAVLRMRDKQGREFFATLTALASDSATFTIGAQATRISLGALAAQWFGDYTALWCAPQVVEGTIKLGDEGPAVTWLMNQLATIRDEAPQAGRKPVFDQALMREVRQFQFSQGLAPDGAVGVQTLIRLSSVGDTAAPQIVSGEEGH